MKTARPVAQPIAVDLDTRIAAAYNNALSAWQAGDRDAARTHWLKVAELHAQRRLGVVQSLEERKGLTRCQG